MPMAGNHRIFGRSHGEVKEVEKGRTEDVVGSFVRMMVLYKARPVEYVFGWLR